VPTLIVVSSAVDAESSARLRDAGCEVLVRPGGTPREDLAWLFAELGQRRMTNVLVEGGGRLLGALLDGRMIDEIHAFVAPKLVGGGPAPSAIAGDGVSQMADALPLIDPVIEQTGGDVYIRGRLR
jgi:diaminohydroxyphosphoribosylaminopyrimidine deaminase/5-amino-6-(5-phosphoribosylamino)uracil reductase